MPSGPAASAPSVFISYASQDRAAARRIRDALTAAGLDAWYDESELGGGDVWDQKIRKQIRECQYFMPVISVNTEARAEGYFRREWRLAVERTLDMADDLPFLVPVVLDGTNQDRARVPEKFLTAQWMRLPDGEPNDVFRAWCSRVTSGEPPTLAGPRGGGSGRPLGAAGKKSDGAVASTLAPFPHKIEGQTVKHWGDIVVWLFGAGAYGFRKLPKVIRALIVIWVVIMLLKLPSCSESHRDRDEHKAVTIDPDAMKKAAAAMDNLSSKGQAGSMIAQIIQTAMSDNQEGKPLLAVRFTAASGDAGGAKFAQAVFNSLYGALTVDGGKIGLDTHAGDATDEDAAIKRAQEYGAQYLLLGDVGPHAGKTQLQVRVVKVSNRAEVASNTYPVTMDPADAVADIRAHLPSLDDK